MANAMTYIMTGLLILLSAFIAASNILEGKAPHGAVAAYWICVFLYWIVRAS